MSMLKRFSPSVCKQLQYYVYRLIDPRTGHTFYVGKGKNNRVFAHANDALKNYEGTDYFIKDEDDDESAKIKQIRSIHNSDLEVIMVIHRYGLSEATAYEVESALIDCYPGLTNEQSGHDSDRGAKNVETLQRVLDLSEFDDSDAAENEYMIIKIKQEARDKCNNDIYETVRKAWRVEPKNASKFKYVLASQYGEVVAVFKNVNWYPYSEPGRFMFDAVEVNDDSAEDKQILERYLHKRLPKRYMKKGASNPVQYQSRD